MTLDTLADLRRPSVRRHDEDDLQMAVVQFLELALPASAIYFAVPNGGLRSKRVASRLKAMGVRAGVPDLVVLWLGQWIFIELKPPTGGFLSKAQRETIPLLERAGAAVLVCRSVGEVEGGLRGSGLPLRATVT